jgi:hypothetical protein
MDQLVDAAQLVLEHRDAVECTLLVASRDAPFQDFEVDHHGVQRILDLVGEIIREPAEHLEAPG